MNAYIPILIIVGANICYHICAKSTSAEINPYASLIFTYGVGIASAAVLYFITSSEKNLITEFCRMNWATIVLGFAIVGLEAGNIYMYKMGWNINIGSLLCNILLAVALIIIGFLLYHETMSFRQIFGMVLCLGGIIFITKP